jgi:hypothetical protein
MELLAIVKYTSDADLTKRALHPQVPSWTDGLTWPEIRAKCVFPDKDSDDYYPVEHQGIVEHAYNSRDEYVWPNFN